MTDQFRILVVDDERDTRRLMCEGITSLGQRYTVSGVPSGEEAQLELARTLPHLLVTDVRLAGISGLELLRKVRARDIDLRVIVITGLDDLDIRRQALEYGADAFFTQPLDMKAFLEAVSNLANGTASGEGESEQPASVEEAQRLAPEEKLLVKLENFAREIDARAVVLLDDNGKTRYSMRSGMELDFEAKFIPALLKSSRAGAELISSTDRNLSINLQVFYGEKRIYFVSPVAMGLTLLVVISTAAYSDIHPDFFQILNSLITNLNETPQLPFTGDESGQIFYEEEPDSVLSKKTSDADRELEPDPNLEAIFKSSEHLEFSSDDVDQFWDDLTSASGGEYYHQGDRISYEQARRMGLAPGDEEV